MVKADEWNCLRQGYASRPYIIMMEKSSVVAQINKDQAEIEKSATGPNSPETNVLEDFHEEPAAQRGFRNTNVKTPTKGTR